MRERAEDLLSWSGKFHRLEEPKPGVFGASYYDRVLGHVKLVFKPGEPCHAKAYFGVWRVVGRGWWTAPARTDSGSTLDLGLPQATVTPKTTTLSE